MNIFVKTLQGKTVIIDVNENDTINSVKQTIYKEENIPPSQQNIIYNGKQLDGFMSLKEFGIEKESTLHLVLKLRGG